ncbi:hypothetical protein KEM54_001804 [Ascosphaera aggregata]|nr:hypothetical protein KEM54_001804 [Ascosphaera aggregata]
MNKTQSLPQPLTRKLEQLSGDMPHSVTNNEDNMYAIVRVAPEEKYTIPPLPTRWVADLELKDFEIVGDGLEVRYFAPDSRTQEGCSIRTDHPMPDTCGVYYFEINVLRKTKEAMVAIGLSSANAAAARLVGHDGDSLGYHGDDGRVYNGRQNNGDKQYGFKFGEGDVVGCGYDWKADKAFFTKNGDFLGHAPDAIDAQNHELFPTVGLRRRPQVRIKANFGQFPFKFDIDGYTAQLRRETLAAVDDFDLNGDEEQISKALVAQYLIHEGFTAAATAFERDLANETAARHGTVLPPLRSIPLEKETQTRAAIRDAILKGNLDSAMHLIIKNFPDAIDEELEFEIRCQKFIELIRRSRRNVKQSNPGSRREVPLIGNGNGGDEEGGTGGSTNRTSRPASRMDVDGDYDGDGESNDNDNEDSHMGMELDTEEEVQTPGAQTSFSDAADAELEKALNDPHALVDPTTTTTTSTTILPSASMTDEAGNHIYTYADAMRYGSNLEKLYTDDGSEAGREKRKKLDELFSLLAYTDVRSSPSGYLFDEMYLVRLADEVSAACLSMFSLHFSAFPPTNLIALRLLTAVAPGRSAEAKGGKQFAALERLMQQTEVMLEDTQRRGGLGSIVNIRDFSPQP